MRPACEVCSRGQCRACVGYRGPLQTYLCGCYERNAETDPGMHPLTYEGSHSHGPWQCHECWGMPAPEPSRG